MVSSGVALSGVVSSWMASSGAVLSEVLPKCCVLGRFRVRWCRSCVFLCVFELTELYRWLRELSFIEFCVSVCFRAYITVQVAPRAQFYCFFSSGGGLESFSDGTESD